MSGVTTSRCGGCTLCCVLLVIGEIHKPAFVPCRNLCEDGGCSAWPHHPLDCKQFACMWHANQRWPDGLRPDRIGAILEPVRGGRGLILVTVDPKRPAAWQDASSQLRKLIRHLRKQGAAFMVTVGSKNHVLPSDTMSDVEIRDTLLSEGKRLGLVA